MLTLKEVLDDFADYSGMERSVVTTSSCTDGGETPLHFMAYLGDSDAIRLLVENGSNISAIDNFGNTPLHMAVRHRQAHAVDQLLTFGADPKIKNAENHTPENIAHIDNYQPTRKLFVG